jgi:hypothetical protein
MMRHILRRPSPALVVASLALAVALGGTGYAAVLTVPRNSVGTPQLKRSAVTSSKLRSGAVLSAKIARGAVTSMQVRNGTLLRADFAPGELPTSVVGGQGPAGPAGPAGPPGISGLQRVDAVSGSASANSKTVVVTCPSSKRVVGGGARVTGSGSGKVSIVESYPDSNGSQWDARAAEVVATTATWQLQAYALCATVTP